MIKAIKGLACAVVVAAGALGFAGGAVAHDTTVVTESVLAHHLEAFGNGDLEGILSDYTDDSVMITPHGAVKGRAALKPLFEALFAEFAKPGASFTLHQQIVDGPVGYIVWQAESADNVYELGTDTFVVRNGKIAIQTFAAKVTPKGG